MIELSVVTGTYNRLRLLKAMVTSVRNSLGAGLPYEIVIVDGGSNDGTIEWCKKQPDVLLIEQGKLLGAVKAFNEGATAAHGRYVVLANDDIEFLGETLTCGLSFMHDNPMIGIGCFYQDRGGRDWHVEAMSAVIDGKPSTSYYGQVCIVPKWLGDKVGWWGNYLRTYGGDNELSCNVLELGYRVEPVPCSAVHDTTYMDELRKINNPVTNGNHPDTAAYLRKWTRRGILGPVVAPAPVVPNMLTRPYRVFYAPIYEPGHDLQRVTKHGLRDALNKVGMVLEYDYMNQPIERMVNMACAWDPQLFIFQAQDPDRITPLVMKELRANHPHAKFVNWNGDYHVDQLQSPAYTALLQNFDLVGLVTTAVTYKGVNTFYWQIGYEPTDAQPDANTPAHDVLFLANGYSTARVNLIDALRKRYPALNMGLYGYWPRGYPVSGYNLYDFQAGAKLYRNAKIALSDSQWPRATGFVSNRLFQALEAGAFLMQQEFDGMTELMGLIPDVHLATWRDIPDLVASIEYWLHPNQTERRAKIAAAGQKYVKDYHSFDHRVKELLDVLYA